VLCMNIAILYLTIIFLINMRNGKYELYKKIILEYYFYVAIVEDDSRDFLKVLKTKPAQLIYKKFKKIPSSSRSNVLKKMVANGLLQKGHYYPHKYRTLTRKGIQEATKIMN